MPSIFNHENSCWGVKRSFSDVFKYDLNEELHSRKLTQLHNEVSAVTNDVGLVECNASVHYSVSSNGYYGFQPHNIIKDKTNEGMEVDENYLSSASEPIGISKTMDFLQLQNPRRKRHMSADCVQSSKRMRQEGPNMVEPNTSDQNSHRKVFSFLTECVGDSSVKTGRHWSSRVDLHEVGYETTSQLLRQTHGCELFLYERSCDY